MPDKQEEEEEEVTVTVLEEEDEQEQDAVALGLTEDLPPGRLHATRVPERLQAQKSPHTTPLRRRSLSDRFARDNPRSRSRSPSLKDTASDYSMSSTRSLEDIVGDVDILTDKLGLSELDSEKSHMQAQSLSQKMCNLATLNERMSEETLDDVHAFSDARPSSTASLSSRGNSTVGTAGDVGNSLLETLDECCEDEDDYLESNSDKDDNDDTTTTILTHKIIGEKVMVLNLENLTIHEQEETEQEDDVASLEPVCGDGLAALEGESTV
jgi:hypothetical protein